MDATVPITAALLTCPHCGMSHREIMPLNLCVTLFECRRCREYLAPRPGDGCVFDSFGSLPCPCVQLRRQRGG
jgi:hypothetical protein